MRAGSIMGAIAILVAGSAYAPAPAQFTPSWIDSLPRAAIAPNLSFTPLMPGRTISGKSYNMVPNCYTLMTKPGTRYRLHMQQERRNTLTTRISVSSVHACVGNYPESVSVNTGRNESQRWETTEFDAGGGPYTIMATTTSFKPLSYTLTVTEVGPATGRPLRTRRDLEIAADIRARGYTTEARTQTASTVPPSGVGRRRPGESFRDCADICPEMVALPAGRFMMGSSSTEADRESNEGPLHQVTFRNAFAVGKYEVTGDEWDACVAEQGCPGPPIQLGRHPATNINWTKARAYADWLSAKTGQRYFLPSEAEWEYAARAGTTTPWNTGDAVIGDDANIMDQFKQAVPVGGFPANAFGLHDMIGNVSEWTLDCHNVGYFGVPTDGGAAMTPNCPQRAIRGGYWSSLPRYVRSAYRPGIEPKTESPAIGFRVTRAL